MYVIWKWVSNMYIDGMDYGMDYGMEWNDATQCFFMYVL